MMKIILIGLITTSLSLFSCTERMKNNDRAFGNRSIHKNLTEQDIDTASDQRLLHTVHDNLEQKHPEDYQREYETVMAWNKSRQAIYMIWALETEVNNGGYNQFYFNSSGQFYKHLPQMLRLIGANKFASLTQKANDVFEHENKKITKHQNGTIEGFSKSYDDNPLNEFDTAFQHLYQNEDLYQLQIDYIRKNKMDFIDK
ncbi:DMP19 family protein [Pedobacter immunditicola]|uniref:DMP19 family protein n=1 Tax=Pedobacter immunditicola TaxID=3133440 RepID=UPI0030A9CEBA